MKEEFGSRAKRKKLTVRLIDNLYADLVTFCRNQPVEPTHNAVIEKALSVFLNSAYNPPRRK